VFSTALVAPPTPDQQTWRRTEFLGKPPGSVLFMGPEGSSGRPVGKLVFGYRPEGWNALLNPRTNQWEEVRFAESGQPLYQAADFGPLLADSLRLDKLADGQA
jgi:hypothetical protein